MLRYEIFVRFFFVKQYQSSLVLYTFIHPESRLFGGAQSSGLNVWSVKKELFLVLTLPTSRALLGMPEMSIFIGLPEVAGSFAEHILRSPTTA